MYWFYLISTSLLRSNLQLITRGYLNMYSFYLKKLKWKLLERFSIYSSASDKYNFSGYWFLETVNSDQCLMSKERFWCTYREFPAELMYQLITNFRYKNDLTLILSTFSFFLLFFVQQLQNVRHAQRKLYLTCFILQKKTDNLPYILLHVLYT